MKKYRLWQFILCWVLFFCSFTPVCGQYVVEGQVLNIQKAPIANASIKIKDSIKGLPIFFSISNSQGLYKINLPANTKTYWLECSLLGYRSAVFILPMPIGNSIHQNIILTNDTLELPEINVFTTPPVTVSGDTTTFRTDFFKKGNESNVGELLNVLPGFSVNNGRITYNGKSVTKVLIEEDDLFGSDYNTVTQNLSPKGIEKIQLIENYNDKTYLSNRLKKGDELVVNLKFIKKYLSHIITSNETGLSLSPVSDFYKIRQNIISLIPQVKSVTTTNFNNTGLLASEILGTRFNLPELDIYKKDAINFDLYPRFSATPLAPIPEISSSIVPKNRMLNNHSSMVTNNLLYKPSKKLQFKNIFQYSRDAFYQQQFQTTDYTASGVNLILQNKQFLQKQLPAINSSIETVYSPTVFTQFVYKANISTHTETDSVNDVRQLLETYTNYKSLSARLQQQLAFSFFIDSSRIIDIRAFNNIASSNELPVIYPANQYATFTSDTLFNELHSSVQNKNTEYIFQAKLTCRKKMNNWSVELLNSVSHSHLNSSVTLTKPDSILKLTDTSLLNDVVLKSRISSMNFIYNKFITNAISFRTSQSIESGQLLFDNSKSSNGKTYIHYLPSFKIGFILNKNHRLDVNADFKNKLPQIYNLTEGYIFSTDNSIIRGNNSLQMGISKNLSLSYSYTEMLKKKIIFASSIYYSKEPVMYLLNTLPYAFYTINNTLADGRDMTVIGFSTLLSKYLPAIKSQIGIELFANKISNFYSINNKAGTVDLSTMMSTFKFKTLVTDKLTSNLSTKAVVNMRAIDKDFLTEKKNQSIAFTNTAEFVYRFNARLLMSMKYQNIIQKQQTQTNSIQLADFFAKYFVIKDKLSFMLTGNNLLNNGHFTNVSFTQSSINTQTVFVIRPFWMLHATLEL